MPSVPLKCLLSKGDDNVEQLVETLKGHEISLTSEWVFEVTGEAFTMERQRKFPSLGLARNAIEEAVLAHAKEQKAKITLALPALTETGADFVIRGINSVSSRILGIEAGRGANDGGLYVPTEAVRELLNERAALRKRLTEIQKLLEPTRIESSRGYGNLAVEKYDEAIKALQADYDRAAQAAITLKIDR